MHPSSYSTDDYWKRYQAFFPEYARIGDDNAPVESYFSWRDADIHLDRFACDTSPLTVLLIHGGGGYGRMLAPVGAVLHRAGYDVIAPDLPGYGLSHAPTTMIRYEAWIELLCALVAKLHADTRRPVVLCGASLGGYLAYLVAARLDKGMVAGVIATTLADPQTALVKRQFARNRVMLALMPMMPLLSALAGNVKLPIKWFTRMHAMSNNPALSRVVAADPFGGGRRVPIRFMQSIFTVQPDKDPERFDHCPILLLHPAQDRWTDAASSLQFLERVGGQKRFVMLENCGHFPIEEPGFQQLEAEALEFLGSLCEPSPDNCRKKTDQH
ncbi:alpha/beta hydrolase [Herbaspirillum sp. BH-1]|uniref:Alpha-beta hydrolase superfamily lysophospholipase n=1 Tax=Herbaspirillum frisingense TaxID=92645 RepID=A0ABU1PIR5_9BURK|nr:MULTISPECIES: alpha/beta hydrolase [Herbaspirillum]MDR6585712.1 alpha-beta hydrolase superfamily lysophospholipase [Herbaspirillum frisingense]PLY61375.1 alpha/beta hydrolase [Herbaspirillum sp. BH-1]